MNVSIDVQNIVGSLIPKYIFYLFPHFEIDILGNWSLITYGEIEIRYYKRSENSLKMLLFIFRRHPIISTIDKFYKFDSVFEMIKWYRAQNNKFIKKKVFNCSARMNISLAKFSEFSRVIKLSFLNMAIRKLAKL